MRPATRTMRWLLAATLIAGAGLSFANAPDKGPLYSAVDAARVNFILEVMP